MIEAKDKSIGMTLPEVVLASAFFSVLIGFFMITTKFTTRFFGSQETINNNSNGWLIDSHNIYIAMDRWIEILGQPAYSSNEIKSLNCRYPGTSDGNLWGFPGLSDSNLPKQYKYCITESSLNESSLEDLLLKNLKYDFLKKTFRNDKFFLIFLTLKQVVIISFGLF